MEHAPRLFQCALCHTQTMICSRCDRGQIYCDKVCAILSRKKLMKLAGARYQSSFAGKRRHAARQAAYRKRFNKLVTHQGSPLMHQYASMNSLENEPNQTETGQIKSARTCCFCKKPVSDWIRNDFLRRRRCNKSTESLASPQAP